MWGLTLQNFPGFLWWKDYQKDTLPMKIRAGETWKIQPNVFLSVDGERRFYHEGSHAENFLFAGIETFTSEQLVFRFGSFGTNLEDPDKRHVTAGATFTFSSQAKISYAYESFKINGENVKQSFVSILSPFGD